MAVKNVFQFFLAYIELYSVFGDTFWGISLSSWQSNEFQKPAYSHACLCGGESQEPITISSVALKTFHVGASREVEPIASHSKAKLGTNSYSEVLRNRQPLLAALNS